jgi:hypothetical protein
MDSLKPGDRTLAVEAWRSSNETAASMLGVPGMWKSDKQMRASASGRLHRGGCVCADLWAVARSRPELLCGQPLGAEEDFFWILAALLAIEVDSHVPS